MRIFTWNTLANICADNSANGFPHADPNILEWDYRFNLITKILEVEIANGTIFCLQEVDKHNEYEEFFFKHEYDVVYSRQEGAAHGILVAYPKTIKALSIEVYQYPYSTQQMVKIGFPGFTLITTHLKAKDFTDIRTRQVHFLLSHVNDRTIVCGDFNAPPSEKCIQLMSDEMKNLYPNSEHTTCKMRQTLVSRCIDYMFVKGIVSTSTASLPMIIESPNKLHPSDHYPLCAEFML